MLSMPFFLGAMDPNLFHLDWDRTAEVLIAITILSLLVERALAPLFESRWFLAKYQGQSVKEPIAFLAALGVCASWDFDAVSMVVLAERTNWFGYLVTAGVIAGGSKASIALFQDFLKIKSGARKELDTKGFVTPPGKPVVVGGVAAPAGAPVGG
jgi:hypothetical protein